MGEGACVQVRARASCWVQPRCRQGLRRATGGGCPCRAPGRREAARTAARSVGGPGEAAMEEAVPAAGDWAAA